MLLTMIINNIQELYTFIPNKLFGQLRDISKNSIFSKTLNLEFSHNEIFTYQNFKRLEM